MKLYYAFIDGASRGNPGKAGAGIRIVDEEGKFDRGICQYLGDDLTNNQAEYGALILLLRELVHNNYYFNDIGRLIISSDSRLMVKQMSGEFKVKNENLAKYYQAAEALLVKLDFPVEFRDIPREENKQADKLANLGIDLKK